MNVKPIPLSKSNHLDHPRAVLATLKDMYGSVDLAEQTYSQEFERRFAETSGTVFAVAMKSSSDAVSVIFHSLALEAGSEVICPPYCPMEVIKATLDLGLCPVFADIDPRTYALDLHDVTKKISDRTRALFLVHHFGIPADGERFSQLCREQEIFLVEMGAGGLGASFNDRPIGTFGTAAILSFHPRKLYAMGDGGMLLTDNDAISGKAQISERATQKGSRMSDLEAALGLWALEHLQEGIETRSKLARRYDEAFDSQYEISTLSKSLRASWNHHSYSVRIGGGQRDQVLETLTSQGIEGSIGPHPLHLHPYLEARLRPERLPQTEQIFAETLLLPMFTELTRREQEKVIQVVTRALL